MEIERSGVACWECGQEFTFNTRTGEAFCGCDRTTVVVNKKKTDYDVDITRPSIFSNPYRVGVDGDRAEVIEKFRERLKGQPYLIKLARERLKGKRLGCVCKPLPCHGDVWIEVLDGNPDWLPTATTEWKEEPEDGD